MTLPSNRPGGLRGPEGSTLDEVVAQLRGINDKLDLVWTELQTQRTLSTIQLPVLQAIYQALGSLAEEPAGRSLKYLLADIKACLCEETAPVESIYTPAAPPVGGCGGSYSDDVYIQLRGWDSLSVGGRQTALFYSGIGGVLVEPTTITTTLGHTYNALRRVSGAGNVELCAIWDSLVSPAAEVKYQRYNSIGGGIYENALGVGNLNGGAASGNDEVFLDEDAIVIYREAPTGAAGDPQFKLWLKGLGAS